MCVKQQISREALLALMKTDQPAYIDEAQQFSMREITERKIAARHAEARRKREAARHESEDSENPEV